MGVFEWLARSVGQELDERVHGTGGVAHVRFGDIREDADLIVRASVGADQNGTIVMRATPRSDEDPVERHETGEAPLAWNVGPGGPLLKTDLTIVADVLAASEGSELAALVVEIWQPDPDRAAAPPPGRQTFSVESRFDEHGRARLTMTVRLA